MDPSVKDVERGRALFTALLASVITSEVYSLAIDDGKMTASTCVRFAVEAGLLFALWRGLRWARWFFLGFCALGATAAIVTLSRGFTTTLVALATYYLIWLVILAASKSLGAFQWAQRQTNSQPLLPSWKSVIFFLGVVAIPALIMNWGLQEPTATTWVDVPNKVSIRTEFLPSARSVSKQLVGFARGIAGNRQQVPQSVEIVEIRGLRGVCYRGESLSDPEFPKFAATLLFGKRHTYALFAVGRVDVPMPTIEAHCGVIDDALFDAVSVNEKLIEDLKISVPAMRGGVGGGRDEISKPDQSAQPTPRRG